MDILNSVSPRRFRDVDDLLAFISIYDDRKRTRAYRALLTKHRSKIRDAVCVEGGCGLALFSIEMVKLGAKRVYAVEQNPLLADLARARIDALPRHLARRIEVIVEPLQAFQPPQSVDVLLHEFYGQLLYDEDLWVLHHLKFRPTYILPNGGVLRCGVLDASSRCDRVIASDVLRKMHGVLVSGLFEERFDELKITVLTWNAQNGLRQVRRSVKGLSGDLLCFGMAVMHDGKVVCEAGKCPNWSYVWTPRVGDEFLFSFRKSGPMMNCHFRWLR